MVNINISIMEEAYRFLKSMKSKNKSFSDIILTFKEKNKSANIMRFFGALNHAKWYEKEKRMLEFSKELEKRLE